MKRIFAIVILFTCAQIFVSAQNRVSNDIKGVVYDRETAVDFRLHTHGWAINMQFAQMKTYYKTRFYSLGIGELKSYKEVMKSTDFTSFGPNSSFRSYSFGKQNNAFVVRGGVGFKQYFTEKAAKNGVAVGFTYSGGITAALMKPYYLEISTDKDVPLKSIKYTDETAFAFLDESRIKGKSGLFKGLNEVSIIPGIHAQAGVHVDWGAFDEFLRAVEVGIMLDVFPKKLPIMVYDPATMKSDFNRPFFLNFYASIQLGKRK